MALLVAWSGVINVAASAGHPEWLNLFLHLALRRSVALYSRWVATPEDLDDAGRIRLGAAHFQGGCAPCHGAPDQAINPVFDHMLPAPPDLAGTVPEWKTEELYRIVRHGLQFAGMPAWSGGERPDEVWSVVAFLRALPTMSVAQYQHLASGNSAPVDASSAELVDEGARVLARIACDRCHETATAGPIGSRVPRLAGQQVEYLARALREYRDGSRRSGIMQPVAARLDEEQIRGLAAHYASLQAPSSLGPLRARPGRGNDATDDSRQASVLVLAGDRERRIPPCIACHGETARADYPWLAGQSRDYLEQQLRLWQRDGRRLSPWGHVMGAVAVNLDDRQISLLAEWIAAPAARDGEIR